MAGLGAVLLWAALNGCRASASSRGPADLPPPPSAFRREALKQLGNLGLEAKCGQLLLLGVGGNSKPSRAAVDFLSNTAPGGILLFGFNVAEGPNALAALVGGYQDGAAMQGNGLPLIVAIDHEGGTVFRFKQGVTRLPSPALVGERGGRYAGLLGRRAGLELAAIGVNLALAPVVETLSDRNAELLGSRSYGRDPRRVDDCAGAFIEGLALSGVAATAKHFPGNAATDPHRGLPILEVTKAELERDFLPRFRSAISHGAAAVLLSHVLVPSIDASRPATLSYGLTTAILKKELGFEGIAVTDDLFMKALTEGSGSDPAGVAASAVAAVNAGADLLMLSDGQAGPRVKSALVDAVRSGRIAEARLDDAVVRILELKLRFGLAAALDPSARARRIEALPAIVEESKRLIR